MATNHWLAKHKYGTANPQGGKVMAQSKPGSAEVDGLTETELARYFEEHKDDDSLWETTGRRIRRRRGQGPSTSFAVRITPEEISELQAAANLEGKTLSDFIRSSALSAARREPRNLNEATLRRMLQAARAELKTIRSALDKTARELDKVG
jgi:uncharacterized protein (DUF1778 family)